MRRRVRSYRPFLDLLERREVLSSVTFGPTSAQILNATNGTVLATVSTPVPGTLQKTFLNNLDLRGADLSGVDLSGTTLTGSNLHNDSLAGANLSDASANSADMGGVDLSGANLSRFTAQFSDFTGSKWIGASAVGSFLPFDTIVGADLTNANFTGGNFLSTNLSQSTLTGSNFNNTQDTGANFSGSIAWYSPSGVNVSFEFADLDRSNWSNANVLDGDFTGGTLLTNANLTGLNALGTNFQGANFSGSDLSRSFLVYANLKNTNATGTLFQSAILAFSDCTGMTASGADFTTNGDHPSNLFGTNFTNANLSNSNFTGAQILTSGTPTGITVFTGANLTGAIGLPASLQPPTIPPPPPPVPPLVASAGGPYSSQEGSQVNLAATASGGTSPYTYAWDFDGSGNYATAGQTSSHVYTDNGTYSVGLKVTDGAGKSVTTTTTVNVSNVAPTANAGGPYTVTAGQPLTFNGSATDPGAADTAFGFSDFWNFGDGGTAIGLGNSKPTHTYSNPGTYTVTMTATDKDGAASQPASTTVTVTAPVSQGQLNTIATANDKIPDFGTHPTVTSIASGNWSNPAIWSTGAVPTDGAIVDVVGGNKVTFDLANSPTFKTVEVQNGGELDFLVSASETLNVGTLEILQGGTFDIGVAQNPVGPNFTDKVVFADQPIDSSVDPSSFGTGLIDLGTVNMVGAAKSPYLTLATEAHAGDTTIHLAAPAVGWKSGDRLVFPDSRQLTFDQWYSYQPQYESATIASVSADGLTVTLTSPLQFSHLGGRDASGTLRFLPQVQDLTRNIVLTSANPNGTRGHTMYTGDPNVDIENVDFLNLGRTTDSQIDSTTFNSNGTVSHLGTNQIGRYALHVHHDAGPAIATTNGHAFTLIDNAIDNGDAENNIKWGITVHNSDNGLIQGNDVYNVAGSGIVTEDGSETGNVFDSNMVVRVTGVGGRNDSGVATSGDGFWLSGPKNVVTNNIVSDVNPHGDAGTGVAYELFCLSGANNSPINVFSGNTAYGATNIGMEAWYLGSIGNGIQNVGTSTIKDLTMWHINRVGFGEYATNNLTFDGYKFIEDPSISPSNGAVAYYGGDYLANNTTITNSDIEGANNGITPSTFLNGTTMTISNSYFANINDINLVTLWTSGASSAGVHARKIVLANDTFDLSKIKGSTAIKMNFNADGNAENLIEPDQLFVTDYNGVAGDNFQVFYNEQAANFVVPQTTYSSDGSYIVMDGSPEAGLTNAQTWAKYNIAIAGAVAPSTAHSRAGIVGLVN